MDGWMAREREREREREKDRDGRRDGGGWRGEGREAQKEAERGRGIRGEAGELFKAERSLERRRRWKVFSWLFQRRIASFERTRRPCMGSSLPNTVGLSTRKNRRRTRRTASLHWLSVVLCVEQGLARCSVRLRFNVVVKIKYKHKAKQFRRCSITVENVGRDVRTSKR